MASTRDIFPSEKVFLAGADYSLHRHDSTGPYAFPAHTHRGYIDLLFVVAGELRQVINGEVTMLRGPALMLLREHDHHDLAGRDVRFWNLNIRTTEWRRLATYLGDDLGLARLTSDAQPPCRQLRPAEARQLEPGLRLLFARQRGGGNRWLLARTCIDLLALLAGRDAGPDGALYAAADGSSPRGRGAAWPTWLTDLLRRVEGDPLAGLSLAELVARSGHSHEHLARSFRRYLGCTPGAWLNRRRIEQAALLLERTDRDILELALDLGFQSTSHFYRTFKAAHGQSPAAWRAQRRAD